MPVPSFPWPYNLLALTANFQSWKDHLNVSWVSLAGTSSAFLLGWVSGSLPVLSLLHFPAASLFLLLCTDRNGRCNPHWRFSTFIAGVSKGEKTFYTEPGTKLSHAILWEPQNGRARSPRCHNNGCFCYLHIHLCHGHLLSQHSHFLLCWLLGLLLATFATRRPLKVEILMG